VTIPAWQRRRFERLGIPLPPDPPKEPTQAAPEHAAGSADLRAIERAERERMARDSA